MTGTLSLLANTMLLEGYGQVGGSQLVRTVSDNASWNSKSTMRSRAQDFADPWDSWWMSFLKGGTAQLSTNRRGSIHVVDLFASAGGLSLGLREAARALNLGFNVEMAADLDSAALASYQVNFDPSITVNRSVRELVDFQILNRGQEAELAGHSHAIDEAQELQNIDVIIGGPPCQGHSSLNNHTRGDDYRNDLYLTMPALAIALNADALIIENVPRVTQDKQQVVATSLQILKSAGYLVSSGILSAKQFGWPQNRSRHFLIATRKAQPIDLREIAAGLERAARPLWWAIGDLEGHAGSDGIMDAVPRMSAENVERVNWLFDHDAYELPNHVRPDCHKDGHTYPSVYGRLDADQPAPTITTGFQTPGRGRYIHPTERRVLTPREAARIQGFPDTFQFSAGSQPLTRGQLQKWIGDAVPSILGYVAGLVALSSIR